jgi:hypothetical protein
VPTVQTSVQTAPRGRGIIGSRIHGGGRWLRAGLVRGHRCLRCVILGLPMGNEVLVARATWPGRGAVRLATGPMWPVIGNSSGNLGARPKNKAETERDERQGVPLEYHATRWVVTGSLRDGLISWRDCGVSSGIA